MIKEFVRNAVCAAAVVLLSGCSDKPGQAVDGAASAAPAATDARTMTAPAISPEHADALKGIIARNGGQCADIVSVQGEDLSSMVKVTCSGHAGDAGNHSYSVDLETEQAQKD